MSDIKPRSPFSSQDSFSERISDSDKPVKDTFQDALSSRCSAASKGYLVDPYVSLFGLFQKKTPMINRGTYIRTRAVDDLVHKFLTSGVTKSQNTQIISFGAGMDTRYFNLLDDKSLEMDKVSYFEVDFPEIVQQKSQIISKNPELNSKLLNLDFDPVSCILNSQHFKLFAGDLRLFNEELVPKLISLGFDSSTPSLFIAECVFVYIEPEKVDEILKWISSSTTFSVMVSYEQVLSNSSFGKMMISNLQMRGIKLKGLEKYPNLQSQKERYLRQGWSLAENKTIWEIEKKGIPPSEISRINKIEQLDEIEEWMLLSSHYSVLIALTHNHSTYSNEELASFLTFSAS
ncbi:carboxy methyl transferase for protein phosphatase 2A [Entomophthora muscae]|uniref:Carboxy methyl transferase for protein phosphatase 2A n=1 Tax=Entomophthora muscae TaxID=34485 RepID=A0ACC2S9I8_9FUNG|nr:carboxy methyl transferase for protein phosphatase 2A [Entomophthora muscae]